MPRPLARDDQGVPLRSDRRVGVAVPLCLAKRRRPPECARCLLRAAPSRRPRRCRPASEVVSILKEEGTSWGPGQTVVLAEADEQSDDVVDQAMARLGGTVLRRSVDDVEAEIAAAEHAQRAAKREARKQLLETRRSRAGEEIRRIVDALKARAHALRQRMHDAAHKL